MLRIFALVLEFTSEIFTGHSYSTLPQQNRFQQSLLQYSQPQHALQPDVSNHWDWVVPMSAARPFNGERISDRNVWDLTCDSEQDKEHSCQKIIDGDRTSYWLTNRTSSSHPNVITVDLKNTQTINGIAVWPRRDNKVAYGRPAEHEVFLSSDGKDWGSPVAYGTWWSDIMEKFSAFEPRKARFVRLAIWSDAMSSGQTAIAEFNVYTSPSHASSSVSNGGLWGPTIDTPIVPITAFVDPLSGQVVMISSKEHDNFPQDRPAFTLTTLWDPVSKSLSQAKVEHTNHNMFCPGTAFDAEGRMVVSGGATGTVTSIFNGSAQGEKQWIPGAGMVYPRGYHSAVLNADGRIFVIGGSWGSENFKEPTKIKDGEIYDPETDSWTFLPGCLVTPMLTEDGQEYRKDNHGWLFAWKNDTVFQAGPSRNMHWYSLAGKGDTVSAGKREDDNDAMCGQAIMYDAVHGHVLTFGGAPDYLDRRPTSNSAFRITLGEPNSKVQVERVESMWHNRTYAQATVVPNGDVIVTGGNYGVPHVFTDENPVFQAEMFSPSTGKWTKLSNSSIVRSYHSFTILLPDATIVSGGGGLCGDSCQANHFDFEIFTPPYLLASDGQLARRPVIVSTSNTWVAPGGKVTIMTDTDVEEASLIRYSGTTHTVDNDQRRIPLTLSKLGKNKYEFTIPSEGYISIPGYWMLFVMDAQGVPSVATNIKILIGS